MKQFLYEFLCNRLCTDVVAYVIKPFLRKKDEPIKMIQPSKTIEDYEYEFEAKMRGKVRWRKYTI